MYDHGRIDKKWQDLWEAAGAFGAQDFSDRPKKYVLVEFPYPSGAGLHVGHTRSYTALDVVARRSRMQRFNVLYPMGWDAFGLPTENFALKTGRPPAEITAENVATFKRQIKSLGLSFDWSREIDSTDPSYYKWTQWQFLQFFNAGLAYKAKTLINWCPACKIGLANEEAAGGVCDRCGGPVEKREKEQWMIGITKYADRLLEDLKTVNYLPKIAKQQEEWIGKSKGAEVVFDLVDIPGQPDGAHAVTVFTTRPDTLFGATYLAISAEFAQKLMSVGWRASDDVKKFMAETLREEAARTPDAGDVAEKKGVFTGVSAINPVNGEKIPVWIANYVLSGYGTGAIMAVPAHDERDFEFAKKFGLWIRYVVKPTHAKYLVVEKSLPPKFDLNEPDGIESYKKYGRSVGVPEEQLDVALRAFEEDGVAENSDFLNGLATPDAKQKMIAWLEEHKKGSRKTTYKLRDWVFSRQRYWGEPIPLVYCAACAQKKQKALMIHGFSADGNGVWFPFLKNKLEDVGFEVYNPTMQDAAHPSVASWNQDITANLESMGEDDVVIAHSIGAKAVLHAILESKRKIGELILVAPAIGKVSEQQWVAKKSERQNVDIDALRSLWEASINLQEINSYVRSVRVIFSADDSRVPVVGHEVFPMGWYIHKLNGFGHFFEAEIPELSDIILTTKITGWNPIPDSELPLVLPHVTKYEPTDTGESPLAAIPEFVNTKCPRCGGPAKRETDTMPNWAGSSWYFLRYIDAHNDKEFAAADKLKYWMPVDLYNGGTEHTTLHLLYSRFWNKFMYDCGYVPTSEPYARRVSHGLIMAEDGTKMSKSKGNVVNPDEIVQAYGADTLRLCELFIGPFSEPAPWSVSGVSGVRRFLDRVMRLPEKIAPSESEEVTRGLHKMIKAVSDDFDRMSFNTAVAQYMTFVNIVYAAGAITAESLQTFTAALNVAAPHVGEELWERAGGEGLVCSQPWPSFDSTLVQDATFELVIQINGKVRDRIQAPSDASDETLQMLALGSAKIQEWLAGAQPQKMVIVKNKLVSIVV